MAVFTVTKNRKWRNASSKPKDRPDEQAACPRELRLDHWTTGWCYPGKRSASEILKGARSTTELRLSVTKQADDAWRNRIYLGDNLGILRALLDDDAGVRGRVGLVYIDPPFATGSTFAAPQRPVRLR